MNTASMRTFFETDPWTRELIRPGDEPARTQRLMGSPHDADGITLGIVELTGEAGDGYVTDIRVDRHSSIHLTMLDAAKYTLENA